MRTATVVISLLGLCCEREFSMMRRCFYLILFAIVAASQTDAPRIEGFVTSDLASIIPDARVGIDSLTRGFHRETSTNNSGYYLLDDLTPLAPTQFGPR
jgi:hypothetical protein